MAKRRLPEDFQDFLRSLSSHEVRYLLLGGWAVGIYGFPRATKDIDFLIAIDDENLKRLGEALLEFGAPTVDMNNFRTLGQVFRIGQSPMQIGIINEASGIDFEECYSRRNVVDVEGIAVSLISKADLIANKKAAGRHQDLADAERLQ